MSAGASLLAAVRERLARHDDGTGAAGLLEDSAAAEARELLAHACTADDGADVTLADALEPVGRLFWLRFLARGTLRGVDDPLSVLDTRFVAGDEDPGFRRGGPYLAFGVRDDAAATADFVSALMTYACLPATRRHLAPEALRGLCEVQRAWGRFATDAQLDRVDAALDRFEREGGPAVSGAVVAALTPTTVDLVLFQIGRTRLSRMQVVYCDALVHDYEATRDPAASASAVELLGHGLRDETIVAEHALRAAHLIVRAVRGSEAPEDDAALAREQALGVLRRAARGEDGDERDRATAHLALLALDVGRDADAAAFDEAIELLRGLVGRPTRPEVGLSALSSLHRALRRRDAPDDERAADRILERVLRLADEALPAAVEKSALLDSLASASPEGHPLVPALLRAAVLHAPRDDPSAPARLRALADVLVARYDELGDVEALLESAECLRTALAALALPDDSSLCDVLGTLGDVLVSVYDATEDPAVVEEAVQVQRQALEQLDPTDPRYVRHVLLYATALATRFEATRNADGVSRHAATVEALAAQVADSADRADLLASLGRARWLAYARSGAEEQLEAAVEALREAVELGTRRIRAAPAMSLLGVMLTERWRAGGDGRWLDEAVVLQRRAVDLEPENHPENHPGNVQARANLAAALYARFQERDDTAALEEACLLQATAVAASDSRSAAHCRIVSGLPSMMRVAARPADVALLNHAVELQWTAVLAARRDAPGWRFHAASLSESLLALEDLVVAGGAAEAPEAAKPLVDRAVELSESAIDGWAERAPEQLVAACVRAHLRRAVRGHEPAAGAHALRLVRAAMTSPRAGRDRSSLLGLLVAALRQEHGRTGDPVLLKDACDASRELAGLPEASARTRYDAAIAWTQLALANGDAASAVEGCSLAVGLVEEVVWRGLGDADQERLLANHRGLTSAAAALAIEQGAPQLAVELLEQGRGVLLGRDAADRMTYERLHADAPELAERLRAVERRLALGTGDEPAPFDPEGGVPGRSPGDVRVRLAGEHEQLVAAVRELPGWARFRRPPSFAELAEAAGDGVLAIVNVTPWRSDALVVERGKLRVVPLPGVSSEVVAQRTRVFAQASERRATDGVAAALDGREAIVDTLAWLWDRVAEPVVVSLGWERPGGGPLPRLTWCPTHDLASLPLHAAGRAGEPAASLPSLVVSSYTPTLRSLLTDRPAPAQVGSPTRPVLVAMGTTPGHPPLPAVDADEAAFRRRLPGGDVLRDGDATVAAVLSAVERCDWLQVACHADVDERDPSQSGLLLSDGSVTVRDLRRGRIADPAVAVLLGCRTAHASGRLGDEALTLASALRIAGFRHVVGTLCSVGDEDAAFVAEHLLAHVSAGMDPPRALHAAVGAVRERFPHAPARWMGFVHLGR